MRIPKRNPRREFRLKQRELIDASPFIAAQFPQLNALKVTLDFFDPLGGTKNGGMTCKLNVQHAKTALWFACPGVECLGGDFDLSHALAKAVAGKRTVVLGELRCLGTRTRGDHERLPCDTILRYKLNLGYDGSEAEKG